MDTKFVVDESGKKMAVILPLPVQSRKMKGSESSYRLWVGDYRVIYQVDTKNKVVTVYHARHRKDVYER